MCSASGVKAGRREAEARRWEGRQKSGRAGQLEAGSKVNGVLVCCL